jgi:mandelate racemase
VSTVLGDSAWLKSAITATPTAHWLEHVDWAAPVLAEPLRIESGAVVVPDRPGAGMSWDEDAVARYRVG